VVNRRRSPILRLFARFFRLIWGDDIDPPLRPLLLVSVCGATAGSAAWVYLGIWAIDELGASGKQLGATFLVGALLASFSGYLGGHLSDKLGRRPLILVGWALEALYILLFVLVGGRVWLGLALMMMGGILGSLGGGANQAMVADLVPPERHERAYASVRVAQNLGVTLGPPLGGLLLIGENWNMLFLGVAAAAAGTFLIAWRYLPRTGAYAPEAPPERGSFRVITHDHAFLLFWVSGILAYLVYVAYETVLPISAVDTYGLAPAAWGFIVIINPALVTLFQMRVTRWTAGVPPAPKLVAAMLLMGWPLLLLSVNSTIPMLAFVVFVFVVGEMLWVPTSQSIVARLAPVDLRGAYMGAFGSTAGVAFALGPFIGLTLRDAYGETAMWSFFAAAAVVAAATGAAAVRFALGRVETAEALAPAEAT
jgi:predicted MFS family arabinose efflux permease